MVGNGKPRLVPADPLAADHYQALPAASIKPNTPNKLDSTAEPVVDIIDTMGGGPEGRYTTDTIEHGIVIGHRRSGGPHPKTTPIAPTTAYDPILHIEGNNFGKEFLRMAGIVQMLHVHKPPNDKYPYHAHGKRKRLASPRNQIRASASMASQVP